MIYIPLLIIFVLILRSVINNRDILIAILTHTLAITRIELNLLEDDSSSCGARHNRQRIEATATCVDGPFFPASPYFRLKPGLMEEWPLEGIALMRVAPDCRSHMDKESIWSVCGNCKSILYHLKLPDTGQQYTRLRAILFDDAGGCGDLSHLAKKIYGRTGMACLILCRPIARIHLYIENRLVCLGDSRDLGFEDLVTLLENSAI